MIRWNFCFDEGNIAVDLIEAVEDTKVREQVQNGDDIIYITGQGKEAFVNMAKVKVIVREFIADPAPSLPETAEPTAD